MKKREYEIGIELTDKQWKKLEPLLPEPEQSSQATDAGRTGASTLSSSLENRANHFVDSGFSSVGGSL